MQYGFQEQFRFERVIELICIAQTIFVLFVLVFMLMYPGRAFESGATFIRALKGLYPSKNSFASELAFGIAAMAFFIRERRKQLQPYRLWMIILLIQGILMAMCQATGPVFCMVIALAALFSAVPCQAAVRLGIYCRQCFILICDIDIHAVFWMVFQCDWKRRHINRADSALEPDYICHDES